MDERVDAFRAARAEDGDLLPRQVSLGEDPVADRVVDVVVDVRDAVDDADDLALERLGLARPCVSEDPVDHLVRQVQALGDARRLLVVPESVVAVVAQGSVERSLAGVPERRMAHVVSQADRLGQILVQPAAHARRRARFPWSRACGSCACGSGRRPGR